MKIRQLSRFARFAWITLAYNLFVILWGAFVRATGSGAGCGAHWPLCNGEVIPRAPAVDTLIELTHRLTSGVALVLVIGLLVWALRSQALDRRVKRAAALSLAFTLTEALVGAGLVLYEMVAENTSNARALWMIAHLINTFILLAWLTLTALWASGQARTASGIRAAGKWGLALGLLAMVLLGSSGAVTALGDTLFPVSSLTEGLQQDFDAGSHLFVRLRTWHPVIAVLVGAYLAGLSGWLRPKLRDPLGKQLSLALVTLFATQLLLGVVNVILLAPVWMQLVHLLAADLVWISLVMLGAVSFTGLPQRVSNHEVHHPVGQASQQVAGPEHPGTL